MTGDSKCIINQTKKVTFHCTGQEVKDMTPFFQNKRPERQGQASQAISSYANGNIWSTTGSKTRCNRSAFLSQKSAVRAPAALPDELAYICGHSARMPGIMEMSRSARLSTLLAGVGRSAAKSNLIHFESDASGAAREGRVVSTTDVVLSKWQ